MAAATANDDEMIASINITPLVDIFLVLLIIFMITSSVIDQREIMVQIPKAANAGSQAPKASGLVLDKDGRLFLDGQISDSTNISTFLQAMVRDNPDHQVLIGADRDLKYQSVVGAIDLVRGAGVTKYALKVVRP
ncbi:MAG: biopolymer transporter ExbD [Fibrobacterota bacterium]|nr:biopolymer transporter ExbD [Fibrobacterota bacterium]QQS07013.1 MAG: biopolymer transporter ExbD [Fibrobacterota bacterium]